MSAYLFLFVTEGLSKVLEKSCASPRTARAEDLPACTRYLTPSLHRLLFLEANPLQAGVIKSALGIFEIGLGQIRNPSIFSVLFSNSCLEETQTNLK
jgi:hypothetical protein